MNLSTSPTSEICGFERTGAGVHISAVASSRGIGRSPHEYGRPRSGAAAEDWGDAALLAFALPFAVDVVLLLLAAILLLATLTALVLLALTEAVLVALLAVLVLLALAAAEAALAAILALIVPPAALVLLTLAAAEAALSATLALAALRHAARALLVTLVLIVVSHF
jgi:hypothetical protein